MERTVDYNNEKVQGTEVRFDAVGEAWNVYDLADGSTIKAKTVVMGIVRINGKWDGNGDPIYAFRTQQLSTVVEAPEHLRKK
jgi:hypothetical protein